MVSGTFHVQSQEWRYFSREKSIVHTAHLSQLPVFSTGQTITILIAPPTGSTASGNGFNFKPQPYPGITPYRGVDITNVYNNIPPIWQFDGGQVPPIISGSYGMHSGTRGINNPLREAEEEWWPSTGGTFVFLTYHKTSSSPNGLMDGLRTDLYNGTTIPSSPSSPSLQEADYFIQLGGDGWGLGFFVSEGNNEILEVSAVITIPPNTNLAYWVHPSPFYDNFNSFSVFNSLIMRLGP